MDARITFAIPIALALLAGKPNFEQLMLQFGLAALIVLILAVAINGIGNRL